MLLHLLVACAGLGAPGVDAARAGAPGPSREARVAALHRCFVQQVRNHHRAQAPAAGPGPASASGDANDPNAEADLLVDPAPLGPSSEIFFFDQLADAEKELGGPARLLWCRPWFSGPYLRAHGVLSRRSRVARPAAPAHAHRHHFSHHTDATRVLRASAHAGGQHPMATWARATVEALGEHGGGPTAADADWLAVTTLVPELYLFDAPHAHAFTPSTGQHPTPAEQERARRRFVAHVRDTVAAAQAAEVAGQHALALVHLGVAAHALQDLVAHRGMTEREHAGLTFARHDNPDLNVDDARQALAHGALRDLFARVWPTGRKAQVRWEIASDVGHRPAASAGSAAGQAAGPAPGPAAGPAATSAAPAAAATPAATTLSSFDEAPAPAPKARRIATLVRQNYRRAREVDFATLLRRWESAYTYAPAGQNVADDDVLAAARSGRWDVARTLDELWREDGAGG